MALISESSVITQAALAMGLLAAGSSFFYFRRRREADRNLRMLSASHRIARFVTEGKEPTHIVRRVLKELNGVIGAHAAWFRRLEGQDLVLFAHVGLPDWFERDHQRVPREESFGEQVIREGRTQTFDILERDDARFRNVKMLGASQVVCAPVYGKSTILGIILLAIDVPRHFRPEEIEFIDAAASQLGMAVENSDLFAGMTHSQRQLATTFDAITDRVLVHDADYQVIRVNRALAEAVGKSVSEMLGKRCLDVLPSQQGWSGCPWCWNQMTGPDAEGTDPVFGGYSSVSTSRYQEFSNGPQYSVHIIRDTTQRRNAEENYRVLFEQVQEGVFISTPEGKILDCNDALVRMLGYSSRSEVFGLDISARLTRVPGADTLLASSMLRHGYVRNLEVELRRKDGTPVYALETSFAKKNEQGVIERHIGFLLDMSAIRQTESALESRNKELKTINQLIIAANQAHDADELMTHALDQLIGLFNADTGATYLFEEGTSTLRRVAALGHKEIANLGDPAIHIQPAFVEALHKAHTEILTEKELSVLPSAFGEMIAREDLKALLWVLLWSKEKIVGVIGVSSRRERDFTPEQHSLMITIARTLASTVDRLQTYTELRKAFDDLSRTQEQLLQSEKMSAIGQLISGVAHELNNPLTAILGYVQLLDSEPMPQRPAEFVGKIYKQAQRTHRIVQNLLSFARQRKPLKEDVILQRVLDDTLSLRDYDLSLNNIRVELEYAEQPLRVTADAHQLEQVFLNIINNAVDAMLDGPRGGLLRVTAAQDGDSALVRFHDSGPGIKDLTRVFDPFYTTKSVGKGTGLGLSICYGILKEHGGDITARNEDGAVFEIRLPLATAKEDEEHSGAKAEPAPAEIRGHILVVDSEEAMLEFHNDVLIRAGARVTLSRSGDEAIAIMKQHSFDLVVLSGKLKGHKSGIEVYDWAVVNCPEVASRTILTVSSVMDSETQGFVERTAVPVIVKPFTVADLVYKAKHIMTPEARRSVTSQ